MGKGPKIKHELHLRLRIPCIYTYSKGSYMHLVIVCIWCGVSHLWCSDSQRRSAYLKVQDFRFSYLMHLYFSLSLAGHQNWDTFWGWGGDDHTPGTQLRCVDHLPFNFWNRAWARPVGSLHKEQKAKHQQPVLCLALLQFYRGGQ